MKTDKAEGVSILQAANPSQKPELAASGPLLAFLTDIGLTPDDVESLSQNYKAKESLRNIIAEHRPKPEEKKIEATREEKLSLYERITILEPESFEVSVLHNIETFLSADARELLAWRMTQLVRSVQAGAVWLDSRYGAEKWVKKINPEILSLISSNTCVISQVTSLRYGDALSHLGLAPMIAASLGFHPGNPAAETDPACRALNIMWLTLIKMRLS